MTSRLFYKFLAIILVIATTAEGFVRVIGAVDFPLYSVDRHVGYWPKSNQNGEFLSVNSWVFNDIGMGVENTFSPRKDVVDVLLVGDSIVLGGNTMKQPEKLGPRLTSISGKQYWPISAGSWSLINQVRFLKRNIQILEQVDEIDFVVNSGDFGSPSSWVCEQIHPTKPPDIALVYLFNKYLRRNQLCSSVNTAMQVEDGVWQTELKDLLDLPQLKGKPVRFWLYPNRVESLDYALLANSLELRTPELKSLKIGVAVYSLARNNSWRMVSYVDSIHIDAPGTAIMAEIINKKSRLLDDSGI